MNRETLPVYDFDKVRFERLQKIDLVHELARQKVTHARNFHHSCA